MTKANKEHPVHLEQVTWLLTHRALLNRAQYYNDVNTVNELTRLTQTTTDIVNICILITIELVNFP